MPVSKNNKKKVSHKAWKKKMNLQRVEAKKWFKSQKAKKKWAKKGELVTGGIKGKNQK